MKLPMSVAKLAGWGLALVVLASLTFVGLQNNAKLFLLTTFNAVTLGAIYFLVASGFTLVFGLMRIVNLAHGAFFLMGGYVGFAAANAFGTWWLGVAAGALGTFVFGWAIYAGIFSRMHGEDLRQTLVSIGLSIVMADIILWIFGGQTYQFDVPAVLTQIVKFPVAGNYPGYRLLVVAVAALITLGLWFLLNRTYFGMLIRAGVDDKETLQTSGVNVKRLFALTFGLGAGLAGLAGVIGGSALSISPGEDSRYLLASLIVVILGGMGSIAGAAVGAILVAVVETFGLVYTPTYSVVFTFVLMALFLAFRPTGLFGVAK